jgi:hypothetical protein
MRTNYAFLCDAASQGADGKINALGIGISQLRATQTPVQRAQMVLVAQVAFDLDEVGAKPLAIRVIDPDGGNVIPPVDGEITFASPEGVLSPVAQVVVELTMVTFPRFGVYAVDVAIDHRPIASLPLEVLPIRV